MELANALPLHLRQRLQWQLYVGPAERGISYRTAPQRQLPVIIGGTLLVQRAQAPHRCLTGDPAGVLSSAFSGESREGAEIPLMR